MTFPKRPTSDYPDNFVAITGRNLVDPILKLWVQMGRLHFDGEGVQIINVYHNPEMDTQMLTCICKVENPHSTVGFQRQRPFKKEHGEINSRRIKS